MTNIPGVAIIGAGMAGISCARTLVQAGVSVQLVDKGRGIGGRMATRRVTLDGCDLTFDHGAQYLRPTRDDFAQVLHHAGARGWESDTALVGMPGMSRLARNLAGELPISQQVEINAITQDGGLWHLAGPAGQLQARRVVLTIPAPQALALLGRAHPLAAALADVRMAPCLTLMAAFPPDSPRPFSHRLAPDHPLAWIAQDSSKPGRSAAAVTWVAQAAPEFSATHLERTAEEIETIMRPLLCDVIGAKGEGALYARAHRWRYAQTSQPLGQPFLCDADGALYVGGDWCLGAQAQDAWQSGQAIAQDILARQNAV